jgi:hypothetical protein
MAADTQSTFCGNHLPSECSPTTAKLLGKWQATDLDNYAGAATLMHTNWRHTDTDTTTQPCEQSVDACCDAARQLFDRASGFHHKKLALPTVAVTEGPMPAHINIFSDGTATRPANLNWSVAAYGTFAPNRDLACHPLTTSEHDLYHHRAQPDGVDAWGAVNGPRAASARSELAGGIAAMLAPYPIHLGSDNLGFVKRANHLLTNPTDTGKPWALQRGASNTVFTTTSHCSEAPATPASPGSKGMQLPTT